MSLIDQFMPTYSVRQVDHVAVAASPQRAYSTVRVMDMYRVPFVRLLFNARALPDRMSALVTGIPYSAPRSSCIADIVSANTGFIVLAEHPGREIAIGAVGKFWKPNIELARVTPESFTAFEEPGFAKLAWCFRIEPREPSGSWVSIELRVGATDAKSLTRFRRYWQLIGPFSHAIRKGVLRKAVQELGSVSDDEVRHLPGDTLIAAQFQKTHARTIEAPPSRVWPWLVQMGCQRAGWYSYDRLDNGGVPSADQIVPELQHLAVGDILPARPNHAEGFAVLDIQPGRALVLGSPCLLPWEPPASSGDFPNRMTWAFVLERIGNTATRLIVRVRGDYEPGIGNAVARPLIGVAHEIMERRQLSNLQRRAEAHM